MPRGGAKALMDSLRPAGQPDYPAPPWALGADDLLSALDVDPKEGLRNQEARLRLSRFGRNQLTRRKPRHVISILIDQFRSAVILLLLGAVYAPGINRLLELVDPGPDGWLLIIVMSLLPLAAGPGITKAIDRFSA